MIHGYWLSAGGAVVQDRRTEMIANNLANVNTTGFRRDSMVFQERLTAALEGRAGTRPRPLLDRQGGGTLISRTHTEHVPGGIRRTGVPTDMALAGDDRAFFRARNADGEEVFTRNGHFVRGSDGVFRSASGALTLLDDGGSALQVAEAGSMTIDQAGRVMIDGEAVARVGVAVFDDPSAQLRKAGDTAFRAVPGAEPAFGGETADVRVIAGSLEDSNADAVTELVGLITAQRTYEANLRLLQAHDETLGQAVNDLARLA